MKRHLLFLIFAAVVTAGCKKDDNTGHSAIVVSKIILNETTLTLRVGETFRLTATALPENAKDRTVIWSSEGSAATVDSDGLVTAIAEGEAVAIATSGRQKATCTVAVIGPNDITAGFDPEFASILEYKGYIPDAAHISLEDVQDIERIVVSSLPSLTSLRGIEFFSSLTDLDCSRSSLTSLDLSRNTELLNLDCSVCQLTSFDLSHNTKLRGLDCSYFKAGPIDVSNNTELISLVCENCDLASLDISSNTKLRILDCNYNNLTSLDVSNNTKLQELACPNNKLTALDLNSNTELERLECGRNNLSSLDVIRNTELWLLDCHYNKLTSLDVSSNTKLQFLYCEDNNLSSLDVSNGIELFEICCQSNNLASLDLSHNTKLAKFNCHYNPGTNGIFRVTAPWIDNGTIPQYFTTGSWQYDGRTVTIEYIGAE